ncbi:MAG: hypothetical protein KDN19_19325, partial [Verrucomicrobiae bacterium]|nr:hypothetical protein [Verrucomicrobiae bacterium]
MKSIRRHLLAHLLPGFLALCAGAGIAIYFAVERNLESELDAELREISRALPFGNPTATSMTPLRLEDFDSDDFGIYFEVWSDDGLRLLKSSNLGQFDLQPPSAFPATGSFDDQILGTGDPVRTLSIRDPGTGKQDGLGLHLMVAKTRAPLNQALDRLLIGIIAVGILSLIGFALLATHALRVSLRPLVRLGDQVARMDADSLNARFPSEEMPRELAPIAEKLNELMRRLERSFVRERRFSADLAHELRNPVAALRSIAEVALKWPDRRSDDEFHDVKTISGELQTTIENMLTLARLEKDETELI